MWSIVLEHGEEKRDMPILKFQTFIARLKSAARGAPLIIWFLSSVGFAAAPVGETPPPGTRAETLRQSVTIVTPPGRYVSFRYRLTGPDGTVFNRAPLQDYQHEPSFVLFRGDKVAASGSFAFG